MIILIGGEKGGTGKTTIAVNLATRRVLDGGDVLLFDVDRQGTASKWINERDKKKNIPKIASSSKTGDSIDIELKHLKKKYEDIIIDSGGHDSDELRSAMLGADILIIPIQESCFDIWTLEEMDTIIRQSRRYNKKLKAYLFINRALTNPKTKANKKLLDTLEKLKVIQFLNVYLSERVIYRHAADHGLSIFERKKDKEGKFLIRRDQKAINEFEILYKEIFNVRA